MESSLQPLSVPQKMRLAVEALSSYLPAWWILRERDVHRMIEMARDVHESVPRPGGSIEHQVALRLGRAVGRTLRLLPTDSRCLIQSLVLTRMLSRRSIPSTLVIGVRSKPVFEAHAWVEHQGRPILPAGEFSRLMEL